MLVRRVLLEFWIWCSGKSSMRWHMSQEVKEMREKAVQEAEMWLFLEICRNIKEPGCLKQKKRGKELGSQCCLIIKVTWLKLQNSHLRHVSRILKNPIKVFSVSLIYTLWNYAILQLSYLFLVNCTFIAACRLSLVGVKESYTLVVCRLLIAGASLAAEHGL